jgi:type II secretory pathway predicted ATPase ExeA
MYTEFYGLKEKPFNLTPSPRFIYMSEGHREAMALLTYGVTEKKGFILLTGEVGTGKTTMIHNLLNNLDNSVEHVYLVNPLLSPQEFIDFLAFSAFKKRIHFKSKADFLLEFQDYLQMCLQHQKLFILIVDEAHKLSFDLMEEIRLLSNMEYAEEKLINIFLVGQPELNDNLNSPKGRATLQRIGVRYDIPPLGLKETVEYLETRLAVAGSSKKGDIFQKDAVEAIYRYSKGYPRTINILADNSLLLGYSTNKKTITSSMIDEAYKAMSLQGSFLKTPEPIKPLQEPEGESDLPSGHLMKRVFLFSIIVLFLALAVVVLRTSWIPIPDFLKLTHTKQSHIEPSGKAPEGGVQTKSEESSTGDTLRGAKAITNKSSADINASRKKQGRVETVGIMKQKELSDLQVFVTERDAGFSKSTFAKKGDTLSDLAKKVYGAAGDDEIALLKRHNPEIKDIDRIEVGQKISFPVYTILIETYKSFEKADSLYQQLKADGFDANIISTEPDDKAKSFRVTVGAFKNKKEAEAFTSKTLNGRRYNIPQQ